MASLWNCMFTHPEHVPPVVQLGGVASLLQVLEDPAVTSPNLVTFASGALASIA